MHPQFLIHLYDLNYLFFFSQSTFSVCFFATQVKFKCNHERIFCLQDPQYMQQALTNALLMDAVVGSLQSSKAIYAASKLAHFDRIKMEGRGGG